MKLSILPSSLILRPFLVPGFWNCASSTTASKADWGSWVLNPILPLWETYREEVYPPAPDISIAILNDPGTALIRANSLLVPYIASLGLSELPV